ARSKGRIPNVFWFNPDAEEELAGRPQRGVTDQVIRDLEMVMVALAKADDVVMLQQTPGLEQREKLQKIGLQLPEMVAWAELNKVVTRKLGIAKPWASTPRSSKLAESIGVPHPSGNPALFSKLEHAELLGRLLERSDWRLLGDAREVGRCVSSVEEVKALRLTRPGIPWVIKAPVSTAGRDRMRIEGELDEADQKRLAAMFERSDMLLMEPWLDRLLDFSIQYEAGDGGLKRRGMVVLENTGRGQFRSARATRRPFDGLEPDVRRQVFGGGQGKGIWADWLAGVLEPGLSSWLGDYRGSVGVDAFLYQDEEGGVRMKPIVEVNPRFTMGRVAVELARQLGEGTTLLIQSVEDPAPDNATVLTVVTDETRLAAYVVPGKR
ncbi:MAG: hypothetical protein ACPG4K_00540, partial [Haloferula sp.]